MSTELYRNPILFNKELAKRFEEFDYDKTVRLSRFYFADTSGTIFEAQNAITLFENLNKRFGTFIDTKRSIARRRMYVMTFLDESTSEDSVVEDIISEDSVELVQEDPAQLDAEPLISLEADNKSEVKEFSREYAESLYVQGDEKLSRKLLEDYGRTFNVELKRNKKFVNMLATLEEKLS